MRRKFSHLALAFAALGLVAAAPARPVHHFDILALSPDGSHVATVEGDAPPEGGDPATESLVIRDVATGAAHTVPVPCGDCIAGWPAWSPDGKRLAFTLPIPGGHAKAVYTVAADGGAPTHLTDVEGTLVWLRYGPDGRLAGLAKVGATKEAGATKAGAESTGDLATPPVEQRIAILTQDGPQFVSPPDLNVYEFDWRPDGAGFVGTAAPGDGDAHWWQAQLFGFDARGGAPHLLYAPPPSTQLGEPRVSPDGRSVAFVAGLMSDYVAIGGDAWVLPLNQAGAKPRNVTPGLPGTVTSFAWSCRSGRLLATVLAQDQTRLAEIDPAGTAPIGIDWSGAEVLTGYDAQVLVDCRSDVTATIHESFTRAEEIAVGQAGAWHDLTQTNTGIAAPVHVTSVSWHYEGLPGQGWLLTPDTVAPGARLPLVTVVHGGPAAASQPSFFGPGFNRALLEHGYALFLPNPRGSFGQGEDFVRANRRDLGHGDFRDILAGVDAAIAAAPIDPARLGITGVSYGGFMTMWAGTQTDRFKAGVAVAGISDLQSYAGTAGTVGWLLPYFGASLYDDPAVYARSSPLNQIKGARMPSLLLVGAHDIECPPTQTIEFWRALQALGVPTGAVIYPGEGHGLRDPDHVADAAARAIAWFDRYLR